MNAGWGGGGEPGREDFLVEASPKAWVGEAEETQKEQQNEKTRKQYGELLT